VAQCRLQVVQHNTHTASHQGLPLAVLAAVSRGSRWRSCQYHLRLDGSSSPPEGQQWHTYMKYPSPHAWPADGTHNCEQTTIPAKDSNFALHTNDEAQPGITERCSPDLRLKTHVQHAIGPAQGQVAHSSQRHAHRLIRSLNRPGVATRMSHPRSISRSCTSAKNFPKMNQDRGGLQHCQQYTKQYMMPINNPLPATLQAAHQVNLCIHLKHLTRQP